MSIYFQHMGERGGNRDFLRTIGTPSVGLRMFQLQNIPELVGTLSPEQRSNLEATIRKAAPHGFQIWGIPSGAKAVLRNLRQEDWLLLLLSDGPGGQIYYGGRVIFRPDRELFDLSRRLWGEARFRSGPGCLNRFSASISGASAGVRLPSGAAAVTRKAHAS